MGGFGSIGGFFTGQQGKSYSPSAYINPNRKIASDEAQNLSGNPTLAGQGASYGMGDMSLADYFKQAGNGATQQANLALSPLASSRLASEQTQQDPILSQLFGKGGAMERANTEERGLADRGYSLQPEDYEAYGQASNNIARQFGAAEGSLSQALANRGLSGGGGQAANKQFSGLYGNKNEQLRTAQTDIAQKRMQTNADRLNQTRSYLTNLGSQAAGNIQNQQEQNRAGVNQRQQFGNQQADAYDRQYNQDQAHQQAAMQDERDSYEPGLVDAWKQGTIKGVGSGTESATKFWTGGMGTGGMGMMGGGGGGGGMSSMGGMFGGGGGGGGQQAPSAPSRGKAKPY